MIQALRQRGEQVRAAELDRMAARLAAMPERDRRAVEALTERIVSRLLHEPTVRLKELAERDDAPARLLAELFGLEPEA